MSNPQINFRISRYNIARGLGILKKLEPSYKFISVSQVVRDCFFDYLAKMSIATSDQITQEALEEIISSTRQPNKVMTLKEFVKQIPTNPNIDTLTENQITNQNSALNTIIKNLESSLIADLESDSEISSISDFSPPENWLDESELDENNQDEEQS